MKKLAPLKILFIVVYCLHLNSYSQKNNKINGYEMNNKVRLNFIPIKMPTKEFPKLKPIMTLGGLHYQVPLNDWLYIGGGMHFALFGDQGGLFTLGAEAGINKKIIGDLYFDGNIHFGGGGGYRLYVNDGSFINTNIGLEYKKKDYAIGVQYSYFDFITGKIRDNTVSVYIQIPNVLRFTDYKKSMDKFDTNSLGEFWKQPVVKSAMQVRFDFFQPFGKSKRDSRAPLKNRLYVLGFEYQKYLNEKVFLFAHTDAIYKGLRAGFMDLFLGAGYHPYQSKYINLYGKLGLGSAGGRIAPEGGVMIYPSAGIDIKFSDKLALSTHAGYYRALDGDLEAYTYGFGLKYFNLSGGTKTIDGVKEYKTYKAQGFRINLQNQTYFNVKKTDDLQNILTADLQMIALSMNYDLTRHLYAIGEASFTYKERSGGYAHGVVGVGVQTPSFFNKKMRVHLEGVIGVAGGGGIDTDAGIVLRPTLGLSYDINERFSLFASGGKFISPTGNVNSNNINLGLSFNFATLNTKN